MKKYINPKVNTYSLPEFQNKYGNEANSIVINSILLQFKKRLQMRHAEI